MNLETKIKELQKKNETVEQKHLNERSISSLFSEFISAAKISWEAQQNRFLQVTELIPQREIKVFEEIGKGSIKRGYKAYWKDSEVALVNFIDQPSMGSTMSVELRKVFEREIKNMKSWGKNHPNIIRLLGLTVHFVWFWSFAVEIFMSLSS
jgi:hypothetical protein